jgi:TPR repeat protein
MARRNTKRVLALLALCAALAAPASAETVNDGLEAYRAGRYPQAFTILKVHAAKGDADAQNQIGLMLANGQGVTRDDASAAYWFRRAADFGHAKAQRNLDFLIANGRAKAVVAEEPECR